MDTNRKTLISILALVLLASLILIFAGSYIEPSLPLSREPLSFDGANSYKLTKEFVTRFPRRVIDSLEARQSTGFLHEYLQSLGYQVGYTHFDARVRRRVVGRNVLAFKPGQNNEILAVVAHYDTAPTTLEGAMENGSGVGVLLELARIISVKPTNRSVLFILSDGEEWGMLGTLDIAASYPQRNRIAAAISLDHIAVGDLAAFCLEETGQFQGFSPPWLRQIVRDAARTSNLPVEAPSGLKEHLERALLISRADQGPFLKMGIPAVNLGSSSSNPVLEMAVYHSSQDTISNLKIASFEKYGAVAERVLYSLDALPSTPKQSSGYFRLWDSRYLSPGVAGILHGILFLPLLLIFSFQLKRSGGRLSASGAGREVLAFLETVIPLLVGYLMIGLFNAMRMPDTGQPFLPLYSVYPATPKDPVLENPSWGVLGAVLGAVLFVAIICFLVARFSFRDLPKPEFHNARLILLGLLVAVAALALLHNSYWASLFLALPAWIWAFVGFSRKRKIRIVHWILIIAAGIPFYFFLYMLGNRLELTWKLIWYSILALNTGMFSKQGYILAAAAVAIGIRFLAIQSHNSDANLMTGK
jgi:hypothetical protein